MIPDFVKITGLSRLWKVNQVIDRIQKYHPKQPHYYLQILGVDPNAQGKGLSRHLISPILKQCDLQKMPAYLETATVSNISLYRHFGFELKHTITGLSHNAPEIYCMWRQPRSENNDGYSEH